MTNKHVFKHWEHIGKKDGVFQLTHHFCSAGLSEGCVTSLRHGLQHFLSPLYTVIPADT